MRQLASMTAVIGFFALAFVGWFSDVPVFTCGMRALGGAVAIYLVMGVAGTIVVRIVAEAAVQAQIANAPNKAGKGTRGH
jgi:hypothetical protein